ncbi:hypothetical protein [Leifsonia sp. 2MCAF36]|uniref:hypothetical protein n=1 Tax=Leifsonia sp. 2MCAF36 TaxID=3232988 RepID=UPI003F9698B0
MNDFWIATLSATVAGVVSGLLLALIPLIRTRSGNKTTPSGPVAQNYDGNQIIVHDGIQGAVSIADNSIRITNNITTSLRDSPNADKSLSNESTAAIGIGLAALACLFVFYHPIALALTIGTAMGVLANFAIAIVRTARAGMWSSRTRLAAIRVVFSLAIATGAWIAIYSSTQGGFNLLAMQAKADGSAASATVSGNIFAQVIGVALNQIKEIVQLYGLPGVTFLLTLLAGATFVGVLLLSAWQLVYGWNSYIRLESGAASPRVAARAKKFRDENARSILELAMISAITIVASTGLMFSGIQYLTNQPVLPVTVPTNVSSPASNG